MADREREKTIVCDTKKPVAWIAFATDGSESSAVYLSQEQAHAAADEWGWSVAPLRPTMTDASDGAEPSPASACFLADGIVVGCAVINVLIAVLSAVHYISFAMETRP